MALYMEGAYKAPAKKRTTAADIAQSKASLAKPNAPSNPGLNPVKITAPIPTRTAASYGNTASRQVQPLSTININGSLMNQAAQTGLNAYRNLTNQINVSDYFSQLLGNVRSGGSSVPSTSLYGNISTNPNVMSPYVSWYDQSSPFTGLSQLLNQNKMDILGRTGQALSTPIRGIAQLLYDMTAGISSPFFDMNKALGLSANPGAANSIYQMTDPYRAYQNMSNDPEAFLKDLGILPKGIGLLPKEKASGTKTPYEDTGKKDVKDLIANWDAWQAVDKGLDTGKKAGDVTPFIPESGDQSGKGKGTGGTGGEWWELMGFSSLEEAEAWFAAQSGMEVPNEDWGMYGQGGYNESKSALELAQEYANWQRTMQTNDVNMQIDAMLRALGEEQGRVDPYYQSLLSSLGVTRDASLSGQEAAMSNINKNYTQQRLGLTDTVQAARDAALENALATGTLDSGRSERATRRIDEYMASALASVMGSQSEDVASLNKAMAGVQNQYADTIASTEKEKAEYLKALAQKRTDYENQRGQQLLNIGNELNAYVPVLARNIQTDMNNYNLQAAAQAFNQKLAQQQYGLQASNQAFNQQMAMMQYGLQAANASRGGGSGSYGMNPSQALQWQKYNDELYAASQPNMQGIMDLIGQFNTNPNVYGLASSSSMQPYFAGGLNMSNDQYGQFINDYGNYMNQNTVVQPQNLWQQFMGLFNRGK